MTIDLAGGQSTSSEAKTKNLKSSSKIRTRHDALELEAGRSSTSISPGPSSASHPPSRTVIKEAVPSSPPKPYDIDKWSALLKCDADLAKVAEKLRLLGEKCVDELARSYLILNDKKYLPNIVRKIIADARGELPQAVKEGLHEGRKRRRCSNGLLEVGTNTVTEKVPDDLREFKCLVRTLVPQKNEPKDSFVTMLISNSSINMLILTLAFLAACFLIAFGLW